PPFFGIRIKPLSDQSFDRAIKTLDLFINTLAGQVKSFPQQFVVTLPKVSEIKQVLALTGNLSRLEQAAGLKPGTIGIELMVELPQAIFDASGRPLLPTLFRATGNRCRAVHFGAFDFTAELGISGVFQDINHPACDLARYLARFSLASFNVRFSDSVTTVLPVEIHRRNDLNDHQRAENRQKIFNAWQVHFRNIQRAISAGIYQSWDLHPNQLPARYAAVYSYYLSNADVQASRLKSFLSTAARASLSGNVFDDAASARGVIAFFRRGLDCGAFDAKEIKNLTGLSVKQLRLGFEELLRQLSR
ncbi:MAG TPA: hypothetical protein VNK26_07460, partial [Pyrinomonadaceae bacterium]|nr:hypothetical protein [Pyrinomonadaceae bacterium]